MPRGRRDKRKLAELRRFYAVRNHDAYALHFFSFRFLFLMLFGDIFGVVGTNYGSIPTTSSPVITIGNAAGSGANYDSGSVGAGLSTDTPAGTATSTGGLQEGIDFGNSLAGGATLWENSGPNATKNITNSVFLKPKVNVFLNGTVYKLANGSAVQYVFTNHTTDALTGLTFDGFGINANAANSAFTTTTPTINTGAAFTNPNAYPIIVVPSVTGGSISQIALQGQNLPSAIVSGAFWLPGSASGGGAGTITLTFTGTSTTTWIATVDGMHLFNTQQCNIRIKTAIGATNATAQMAGMLFVNDTTSGGQAATQCQYNITSGNTGGWVGAFAVLGLSGTTTANPETQYLNVNNVDTFGYFCAEYSDTYIWNFFRVSLRTSYGVGAYIGAYGNSGAGAACARQIFQHFNVDVNGTPSHLRGMVIGYYQAGAASTFYPGIQVFESIFGADARFDAHFVDNRTVPVPDYDIWDGTSNLRYWPQMAGQSNSLGGKRGFGIGQPTALATVGSGNDATNTNSFPVIVYITGVGTGITAYGITDAGSGTLKTFTRTGAQGDWFRLLPGDKIRVTFTGSPTWFWYGE